MAVHMGLGEVPSRNGKGGNSGGSSGSWFCDSCVG